MEILPLKHYSKLYEFWCFSKAWDEQASCLLLLDMLSGSNYPNHPRRRINFKEFIFLAIMVMDETDDDVCKIVFAKADFTETE